MAAGGQARNGRGRQRQADDGPDGGRQVPPYVLVAGTEHQPRIAVQLAEVIGDAHRRNVQIERQAVGSGRVHGAGGSFIAEVEYRQPPGAAVPPDGDFPAVP